MIRSEFQPVLYRISKNRKFESCFARLGEVLAFSLDIVPGSREQPAVVLERKNTKKCLIRGSDAGKNRSALKTPYDSSTVLLNYAVLLTFSFLIQFEVG